MTLAGCFGEDEAPSALMDGSATSEPAVELESVSRPAVLTKVLAMSADEVRVGSLSAACVRGSAAHRPLGQIVKRVGVESSSVTFATESAVHGCDDTPGPREGGRRWCGRSFGNLTRGRLEDPRLDIAGCRSASGRQMGFAWIEPGHGTRYVAVEQADYVEAYEPAGGLPVRIATTTGVEVDGSRAIFRLSEHDGDGLLLRRYVLELVPAG